MKLIAISELAQGRYGTDPATKKATIVIIMTAISKKADKTNKKPRKRREENEKKSGIGEKKNDYKRL